MEKKRTITITRETHERIILRRPPAPPPRTWCPVCAEELEMLTPEQAAAIANVSTRTMYRWIEAGKVHHTEVAGGSVLVCPRLLRP